MARLNIEDDLYRRGEWMHLMLEVGSPDTAIGSLVRVWTVAQRYWADGKKLIPLDVWKKEKLNDAVINCGFAEIVNDEIYVNGSEQSFQWLLDKKESGKMGGLKKAENAKTKILATSSTPLAKPSNPEKQPEILAPLEKTPENGLASYPLTLTPALSLTHKEIGKEESSAIPSDILNAIKMQYQFPDDLIEEVRKDAWLQYLASDKPDKNWRRWIGNYFKHEKEKIRNFAINKANEKTSIANTPAIDELVNRVIQNSHLQALEFQKLFTHQELELIRSVGGSRFISSANDFTLSKIKKDLKENAMSIQNSPDRIDTGHAQVSFGTN